MKDISFETAYKRLETILSKVSIEKVDLEKTVELYEEAHKLIGICKKKIHDARKRIYQLTKDDDGNIQMNEEPKKSQPDDQ